MRLKKFNLKFARERGIRRKGSDFFVLKKFVRCPGIDLTFFVKKVSPPFLSVLTPLAKSGFKKKWVGLGALALFLALPLVLEGTGGAFLIRLWGVMGLYGILALGLNLVLGHLGLLDLGFSAFYAIGAYTTAILSLSGWSFWLCLPASVLVAVTVRALLGVALLRLRGDYLSIVTLGFGEIVRITLNNGGSLTHGPQGLSLLASSTPPISFLGKTLTTNTHFFYLIFFFLGWGGVLCRRLDNSRIGRAWIAIREDEVAAQSMGIDVTRVKGVAFLASASFAGVAGSLFARWENFVTPESFTFWESVLLVAMVVLGGMGSWPGVLLGVVLIVGLPELLRTGVLASWGGGPMVKARYLVFGALLVAMALFRPEGLWPRSRPYRR